MVDENKDTKTPTTPILGQPSTPIQSRKVVETYAEDMGKAIEDGTGGLIKKIIEGEEEHELEKENLSPESKKNKLFMIFGVLASVVAVSISTFLFFHKDVTTVPVSQQITPLIFTDKSNFIETVDSDKDTLIKDFIYEENVSKVKSKGIEGIYFSYNKQNIGLRKFLTLIKSNFIPGSLTYVSDNFLTGFMNNDKAEEPLKGRDFFLLLKVRSMVDIFPNLRAWENKMFYDLHGFFKIDLTPENSYLLTKNIEDGIIQNKNARILYDNDGGIVMMYVFIDDNSVLVTNTEETTAEIILRLSQNNIRPKN